jgi:ribulose-5-phosphate 4-epimerase/fuculose-1-phosphate aldolase
MHTHSVNGVAVSAQKNGVLPLSQQSFFVLSSLAYHDYEGVALLEGEKPRLLKDFGDKTFLMLRNHGMLTVGSSVAEAFLAMYIFEAAGMVQVRAQSGGGELIHIPDNILAMATTQVAQVTLGMGGALAWPALLRKLDRKNPGYQD